MKRPERTLTLSEDEGEVEVEGYLQKPLRLCGAQSAPLRSARKLIL